MLLPLLAVLCLGMGFRDAHGQEGATTASNGVTVDPSLAEARVNLVFGIRAYRLGDYAAAAARFEKAAAADPESGTARLWLGFARWRLGQREAARMALESAMEARLSTADAVQAEALLRRLGEEPEGTVPFTGPLAAPGIFHFLERPRAEFRVGLTASADSNPLLLPEGAVAVLPEGTVVTDTPSDTALNLDVRAAFHPFYDRRGWSLGLVFEGDGVRYGDFGVADLTQLRGSVHLAWGADPLAYLPGRLGFTRVPRGGGRTAFLLQGAYTDRRIDGDALERLLQLGATFTVRPCATTATQLDLLFTDREVEAAFAGGAEASGTEWSARASQYIYLGDRSRHLRLGVEAGDRDAGLAFDASHVELELELALPLSARWALQFAVSRREVDYDALESNPLFPFFPGTLANQPREDTLDRWGAALLWEPRPSLRIVARAAHVERQTDSGSATAFFPLDYDRDVASLGVIWLF